MHFFRFKTFFFALVLLAIFSKVDHAEAASLSFTPSAASMKQQCSEKIDIIVDTQGASSNAADAIVKFNPSEVEILDQNPSQPGIQIKPGSAYELFAGNTVNEAQGKIFLTAFSVIGNFNGSALFGSIYFKTKPGVTSTSFSFDFTPGQSVDSNVADSNGNDVLSSVNTGAYTFAASPCVPDTQAPSVTNVLPANGTTNVVLSTNVSFHINDNQSGVDLATLQVQLHNVSYSQGSGQVAITGLPLNYTVTIDPDTNFPGGTEIVLVVQAKDLAGNQMSPKVFSFNRPVIVPPPAVPVCGNGIIEGAEECEPANSLVCDSECHVVVSACLTELPILGENETFITQLGNSEAFFETFSLLGLRGDDEAVLGMKLADVKLDSFVCNDVRIDSTGVERTETPYSPPSGYEIVRDPFSLNCSGSYATTISIPEEFTDVKAVKCIGGLCSDVQVSSIQNVQCGQENMIVQETPVAEQKADIQDTGLELVSFDPSRYRVEALAGGNVVYNIDRFNANYQSLLHSSLKLLSTPVQITRVSHTGSTSESVRLTLPFVADPEVDAKSMQIYTYDTSKKIWKILADSSVSATAGTISTVLDYQKFSNAEGEAVFATFGVVCPGCDQSQFNLAYQPNQPTRAAVVLIHGIEGSVNDWLPMIEDIRRSQQPWQVWTYESPATRSITDNARSLAAELQIHAEEYDVVYLIAYGTGGLVAQQAVTYAHREQTINPNQFTVVNKIKKVVLIGVPNDPLPSENLIMTYYNYLVNSGAGHLFDLKNGIVSYLLQKRLPIAQVPGVKYFVIAGNKGLENAGDLATASLLDASKNDGLVSIASAQNVGGEMLDQLCTNYWEIGANHHELLQNNSSRLAIGRLISQDLSRSVREEALLGHEQYFRLADATCSPDDRYLLIGKKTQREKLPDALNCSCGNGYCGTDEDSVSCPSDCANFFRKENYPIIYGGGSLLLLVILILSATAIIRRLLKGKAKPEKKAKA